MVLFPFVKVQGVECPKDSENDRFCQWEIVDRRQGCLRPVEGRKPLFLNGDLA